MNLATIGGSAVLGLALFSGVGQTTVAGSGIDAPAPRRCEFPRPDSTLPVTVADLPDGLSSDGRGPYLKGKDGVIDSRGGTEGVMTIYDSTGTMRNIRSFTVNLNKPVPGGGGVPLGIAPSGNGAGFPTQRGMVGDTVQNLFDIPVGRTDTAAMISIAFHLNGRRQLLQMGPQANGHCMGARNLVHGKGTSSGTITRVSRTKWAIDLPAGSVGRLFDIGVDGNPWTQAVDKGLYFMHLHYEIGR
ncbi:MAG TPA: hypothetical protein VM032_02060 [Vicinamibacterales bacterium]|nr:hypothetical protein [Vicinamibacterales bacterium]